MQKITPFIWFEKGAKEAAEFYVKVFGKGAKVKTMQSIPNTPSGTVEVVTLDLQGQEFTLMAAGPFRKINEAVSFVVNCGTQKEVDHYWNALSAGGEKGQCGWLKDKYGVSWQVVPTILTRLMGDRDPVKAGRVTQAMLKMKKIDIAALKKAYFGK
ncbi:MAG: VOC family protein [Nitrospiraceae bacterium]|nr:VOC family protein [Nitrospiraceae bacterium]